jgi:hypothetical protein
VSYEYSQWLSWTLQCDWAWYYLVLQLDKEVTKWSVCHRRALIIISSQATFVWVRARPPRYQDPELTGYAGKTMVSDDISIPCCELHPCQRTTWFLIFVVTSGSIFWYFDRNVRRGGGILQIVRWCKLSERAPVVRSVIPIELSLVTYQRQGEVYFIFLKQWVHRFFLWWLLGWTRFSRTSEVRFTAMASLDLLRRLIFLV